MTQGQMDHSDYQKLMGKMMAVFRYPRFSFPGQLEYYRYQWRLLTFFQPGDAIQKSTLHDLSPERRSQKLNLVTYTMQSLRWKSTIFHDESASKHILWTPRRLEMQKLTTQNGGVVVKNENSNIFDQNQPNFIYIFCGPPNGQKCKN